MSTLVIDTGVSATSEDFRQLTQLEGVEYLLRFQWMSREGAWYLGIYDQDENPLATWIKVVVQWDLLRRRRVREPRLPQGLLTAIDTSGQMLDPQTADELGQRVRLRYVTTDDPALAVSA